MVDVVSNWNERITQGFGCCTRTMVGRCGPSAGVYRWRCQQPWLALLARIGRFVNSKAWSSDRVQLHARVIVTSHPNVVKTR